MTYAEAKAALTAKWREIRVCWRRARIAPPSLAQVEKSLGVPLRCEERFVAFDGFTRHCGKPVQGLSPICPNCTRRPAVARYVWERLQRDW